MKQDIRNPLFEITEDKFRAYEQVRQSGVTNMFNVELVCELTDLTSMEVHHIMKHYSQLAKAFPNVVNTEYERKIGIVNLNKFEDEGK